MKSRSCFAGRTSVISSGPVEDPGRLSMDLGTAASVISAATPLFFEGPVIPQIWRLLRSKSATTDAESQDSLVLRGPGGRFVVDAPQNMTVEELVVLYRLATGTKR